MVKHVFRATSWGNLYYEGTYEKETEHFVFHSGIHGTHRRLAKKDARVIETTDSPEVILKRWADARASYSDTVRALEDQLANAKDLQRDACEEIFK